MEKTEVQGIYKTSKGVLINTDNEALEAYRRKKMKSRKIEELEKDMETLKKDMSDIKQMLSAIVDKL